MIYFWFDETQGGRGWRWGNPDDATTWSNRFLSYDAMHAAWSAERAAA
jgi:hypothetical protein